MSTSRKRWTASEIDRLSTPRARNEVIGGERFVTPTPSFKHQRAVLRLAMLLTPHCDAVGIEVFIAPAEVRFSDDDRVEPDLFVLPLTSTGEPPEKFADVGRVILAVEVLSPSSVRTDRDAKRKLYQERDVAEYWVVDVEARVIERWTPVSEQLSPGGAALEIDLVAYFRSVSANRSPGDG
jgi:Uma2 family endonuclease